MTIFTLIYLEAPPIGEEYPSLSIIELIIISLRNYLGRIFHIILTKKAEVMYVASP